MKIIPGEIWQVHLQPFFQENIDENLSSEPNRKAEDNGFRSWSFRLNQPFTSVIPGQKMELFRPQNPPVCTM